MYIDSMINNGNDQIDGHLMILSDRKGEGRFKLGGNSIADASKWEQVAAPLAKLFAFGSDEFRWEGECGVAWMSSLDRGGKRQVFSHIFVNSHVQGFFVQSERTGELMPFYFEESVFKGDDRQAWKVRSATDPKISITIFND